MAEMLLELMSRRADNFSGGSCEGGKCVREDLTWLRDIDYADRNFEPFVGR